MSPQRVMSSKKALNLQLPEVGNCSMYSLRLYYIIIFAQPTEGGPVTASHKIRMPCDVAHRSLGLGWITWDGLVRTSGVGCV